MNYYLTVIISLVQTKIYGSENSKLSKLRPPISKNISDDANRPSSAVANHNRNEVQV